MRQVSGRTLSIYEIYCFQVESLCESVVTFTLTVFLWRVTNETRLAERGFGNEVVAYYNSILVNRN